jgi:uncharacterized membrane protein
MFLVASVGIRTLSLQPSVQNNSGESTELSKCDRKSEFDIALAGGASGLRQYLAACRATGGAYAQRAKLELESRVYETAIACVQSSCSFDSCIALYSNEFSNSVRTQMLHNAANEARRSERCAPPPKLTFSLEVCNKSSYSASVAIAVQQSVSSTNLIVKGWYGVAPNTCEPVGNFAKGITYFVAMERNSLRGWRGTGGKFCVQIPGPFQRVNQPNYSCREKERLELFEKVTVRSDQYTWNISGEPTYLDDETFFLEVCNNDSGRTYVAVIGRELSNSTQWTERGWFDVASGTCRDIGPFIQPYVYVWAFAGDGSGAWNGTDLERCLPPTRFVEPDRADRACGPNDKLARFRQVETRASKTKFNLGK